MKLWEGQCLQLQLARLAGWVEQSPHLPSLSLSLDRKDQSETWGDLPTRPLQSSVGCLSLWVTV